MFISLENTIKNKKNAEIAQIIVPFLRSFLTEKEQFVLCTQQPFPLY